MGSDLSMTNVWLAILATAVVLQTLGMVAGAVLVMRVVKRVDQTLERAEREFGPLAAQVTVALAEVQAMSAAAQRAEKSLRQTSDRVGQQVDRVGQHFESAAALVLGRFAPVIGVVKALRAGIAVVRARRDRAGREDRLAVARFIDEGGPVAAEADAR